VLPNFSLITPVKTGTSTNIDLGVRAAGRDYYYAVVWEGKISFPVSGTYIFETVSDDGSRLYFNSLYNYAGTATVNNDGIHPAISSSGTVNVAAGNYPRAITFFQKEGGQQMQVYWTGPGIPRQLIPDAAFKNGATTSAPLRMSRSNNGIIMRDSSGVVARLPVVYPNPFDDRFTIGIYNQAAANTFSVGLYDFSGKLISLQNLGKLPVGDSVVSPGWVGKKLIPGIYLVRIIINGVPGNTIKLVKAH
jgi:hypothetical protein